jgi:hypothetical protein
MKFISFLQLLPFILISYSGQSQQLKIGLGNNLTSYQFTNSLGILNTNLKPSAGNHLLIGIERPVIDTLSLMSKYSKLAFYLGNKPNFTKLLTYLNYEIDLNYNQFNSVGDLQNYTFSYQTNFIGIQFGFGPQINLKRGYSIQLKTQVSLNKMIHGIQELNTHFVDLNNNSQFSNIQFMTGYEIGITKKINNLFAGYISYQSSNSSNKKIIGSPTLNFNPTCISLGIKIYPSK